MDETEENNPQGENGNTSINGGDDGNRETSEQPGKVQEGIGDSQQSHEHRNESPTGTPIGTEGSTVNATTQGEPEHNREGAETNSTSTSGTGSAARPRDRTRFKRHHTRG